MQAVESEACDLQSGCFAAENSVAGRKHVSFKLGRDARLRCSAPIDSARWVVVLPVKPEVL
jgi:hypothetical protein